MKMLVCVLLMLLSPMISAWSSTSNRRSFLEKSALVGASAASAIAVSVEPSLAFQDKVFQPAPHSLDQKTILITGGSSGLGLESAKRLAAAGATTILTARTELKGRNAVAEVQSYLQAKSIDNPKVSFLTLDLDQLDSIRSFPQRYERKFGTTQKINVLMNNAGVAAIPNRQVTSDGFERTFQSNHLGPFLLTSLLFPYLDQKNGTRIVSVSSIAHTWVTGRLDMGNLNSEIEYNLEGWQSYGQSKLENILFAQEMQRRADQRGMDWLTASALHPGVVGTDIWRNTYVSKGGNNPLKSLSSQLFYGSILSTEEGANTQVWLASLPTTQTATGKGQYFDENGNVPKLTETARDEETAIKLWEKSEELLGVKFEL